MTSIVTALTAIGALVFTGLSLSAARDQVALAEQGQITDRYARAVEQIGQQGPEHLQIRLGGTYALERIARDSPRDQPTIVDVLSAFVRTTLPTSRSKCPSQPLPTDIRAVITVLSRRDRTQDGNTRTDLRYVCLTSADLANEDLSDADLSAADLALAGLGGAKLVDANLAGTNLTNSQLFQANLTTANLTTARLTDAILIRTNLTMANLTRANLSGAILNGADLTGADLTDANLTDANLSRSVVEQEGLPHLDVAGANLTGANLTRANLNGVDLTNVVHDEHTNVTDVKIDGSTRGIWW